MKKIVAVSGGFDCLHAGHVRMIQEAATYGDVIVILNNDNWLKAKKGYVFMPEQERAEILAALRGVKGVIISYHKSDPIDMSVSRELWDLNPHIFCNGGDRTNKNTPEKAVCEKLDIEMKWNVGGNKIQSSSWLVEKANGACRKVIE